MTLYAFSRLVDDAVDEAHDPEAARHELARWRLGLEACFNGHSPDEAAFRQHPVLSELRETIQSFTLPRETFFDLLQGVEMDLKHKRYETFSELERYCYHVAGTIGILCSHLFGLRDEPARRYALLLGTAFQLTNVIRDVGGDLNRGRIYLPLEELRQFSVSEEELFERRVSERFYRLMQFQADRARGYFQKASGILPEKVRGKILPARIMTAFYGALLRKMVRQNFPVLEKRVSLSRWEKGRLVLKTLLGAV